MARLLISGTLVLLSGYLCSSDQPPSRYSAQPSYQFTWRVKDDYFKNNYGQDERSDGGKTSGSYYVALPDGRLQRVTYTVNGDEGFKADVTYEGEAQSSYQQPTSSYQSVPAPPVTQAQSQSYPQVSSTKSTPSPSPTLSSTFEPGEVYYKPIENAPEPEVYYKPLPQASEPEVYYKPLPSGS